MVFNTFHFPKVILFFTALSFLVSVSFAQKPIDTQNFDISVKPTDDFFLYVNGTWMKNNPIPPDQSRWGSFSEVQERNFKILHEILDEAAANTGAKKGSIVQKVGDFYFSGMDTLSIQKQGAFPLADEFNRIAKIKNSRELIDLIAYFHTASAGVPFAFYAMQDMKNSTAIIANLFQSGLGLPDRDYYLKDDDKSKELRSKYLAHVAKMFQLLGDNASTAESNAKIVMDMETRLAKASLTRVELRDPENSYHRMTLDEMSELTPMFPWQQYFRGIGLPNPGDVNVGQPEFIKEVANMVMDVTLESWKTYLRWHLINATADYLSSEFVNEHFDFFGRAMTGQKEMKVRWKRVLQTIDGNIGEALGQLYVEKAFGAQAKKRALEMVKDIQDAFREKVKNLDWMSDLTKKEALRKLDAFTVKIGYPDKWRDYSSLDITRGAYVINVLRASQFEFKRNLSQIGKPVDRTEWGMSPPTVNAYYNPSMNEIVFPAGILQPPFFDANADDAVNYGGIGAVIGHEITHGFDDQGRKFNADGNMIDWWTDGDSKLYETKAAVVEQQFNNYVALDTQHVNGALTLGENIADLGGLSIAYDALQRSFRKNGRPADIDGFTAEQRFFISFGQIWRQNIRDEALRLRLNTDPHSPGRFRCIGPVSNMEEWMKAFDAKEGDPMVRREKAKIW
ncbi:MAG: M13 family metallopeptidase [Ignavibacteriae bacterium]|nr:M13 family metallopeptidase [Ignavibacteriota bacterium]